MSRTLIALALALDLLTILFVDELAELPASYACTTSAAIQAFRLHTDICREHGITEATYYIWKKKYSELGLSELVYFRAAGQMRTDSTHHLRASGSRPPPNFRDRNKGRCPTGCGI